MPAINKTLKFLLALVFVFGASGYYAYYILKKAPELSSSSIVEKSGPVGVLSGDFREVASILENLDMDAEFLSSPAFKNLEYFYERPPFEEAGVFNPFSGF